MGERLLCKQEVIGSIPFSSTIRWRGRRRAGLEGSEARVLRLAEAAPDGSSGVCGVGGGVCDALFVIVDRMWLAVEAGLSARARAARESGAGRRE